MNSLSSSSEEDFGNIDCIQDLENNCLENEEIIKIGKTSFNNDDYLNKEKNEFIIHFLELEENRLTKQGKKNDANKGLNKKEIKVISKEKEEKIILTLNKKRLRDDILEKKVKKKKVCKKKHGASNQNDKDKFY